MVNIRGQRMADPMLLTSASIFRNIRSINKFGRVSDVDTATTPEDVWDGGGIWVPPTTARIHDVVSTDIADSSSGTGGRKVLVEGLDSSYEPIVEIVTLNGTTVVPTTNAFIRIYRMYLVEAGIPSLTNAGTITATAQVDGTVTAMIQPSNGQTLMAIYTIPSGWTGFMTQMYMFLNKQGAAQGAMADFSLLSRGPIDIPTSPWRVRQSGAAAIDGTSSFTQSYGPYKRFEHKTDLVIRCTEVSDNNVDMSAGFNLILAKRS